MHAAPLQDGSLVGGEVCLSRASTICGGDTPIEVDLAGLMVDVDEPLVAGLGGPVDALAHPLLETTTQLVGATFEVANFAEFKDSVKRLKKGPRMALLLLR